MSKFKVGDKVRRVSDVEWFVKRTGKDTGFVTRVSSIGDALEIDDKSSWSPENFELADESWTIYNNDKPLSELSDEQAAEIFNYYRNGGKVEVMSDSGEWCDAISFVGFGIGMLYRAKQKSERELFIDAFAGLNLEAGTRSDIIDALFDAGFKAPKDGE